MAWPILKLESVHCFCSELCQYLTHRGGKAKNPAEIIYSFWGREDINWRAFAHKVTKKVSQTLKFNDRSENCFVLDDTLKARRGKKVEGSSLHHDHNSAKTIQAQQF